MIVKEAVESIKIKKLRYILKRFPHDHPLRNEIESDMIRSITGYKGEKSLNFHLELLPKDDTYIFHDLRIPFGSSHFQIDILILTTSFFLIIEVKHMSGTIIFDQEFHQLIRIYKGIEEMFPDPVSQLYRQTFLLKEWLKLQKFPTVPIKSLVIISNPNTRIKTTPESTDISGVVTHSSNLLARFHDYQDNQKKEFVSKKDIKKLSRLLLKHHSQNSPDLFKKFSITKEDLLKGIACPECSILSMVRAKRKWFCLKCGHSSNKAHVEALKEYAYLVNPFITIHECCEFFQVPSRYVVKYLLNSLDLTTTQVGKHKIYYLDNLM